MKLFSIKVKIKGVVNFYIFNSISFDNKYGHIYSFVCDQHIYLPSTYPPIYMETHNLFYFEIIDFEELTWDK